jgi:hypothetical protein
MNWWRDMLATCIHHLKLYFTDHWNRQTSALKSITISNNRFLSTASTEGQSSASRAYILSSQPSVQNSLSTDYSNNWRPFHTNLLVFSSQADFLNCTATELSHSRTSYFTSLHSTELLTTPPATHSLLQTVLLITSWQGPHRKHRFRCYNPTIRRPLNRNGYLFIRLLHINGCIRSFRGLCPAMSSHSTI